MYLKKVCTYMNICIHVYIYIYIYMCIHNFNNNISIFLYIYARRTYIYIHTSCKSEVARFHSSCMFQYIAGNSANTQTVHIDFLALLYKLFGMGCRAGRHRVGQVVLIGPLLGSQGLAGVCPKLISITTFS